MKRYYKNIFTFSFIAILSMLLISGCGKKDDNPASSDNNGDNSSNNSITINGDGYSNKTYDFLSIASTATYSPSDDVTGCQFVASATDGAHVIFYFHGKSTGTFQWDLTSGETTANSGMVFMIGTSAATSKYYYSKANSGTIKVTSFGSIGQAVSGTFSGTLYDALDATKSITISGKFSAVRTVDGD